MGYNITHVNTEYGNIDIMYRFLNNELYMIPIIVSGRGITAAHIMGAVDAVRRNIIANNPMIARVNILQLVISFGTIGDNEYNSINTFFPYWIVDIVSNRLIIYESQPANFLELSMIIESSLDGRELFANNYNNSTPAGNNRFPVVTAVIALINIVIFFILEAGGSTLDTKYMIDSGALVYSNVFINGEYYRLFTHFFMHYGFEHLVNNMFVFIVLGYHLESVIGKWWYLGIYMISGFASGLVSVVWYELNGELTASAGASGAIFGIIGALFALIVLNKGKLRDITFSRIIIFLILTLYSGVQNPEIDNVAHVSGFIIGAFLSTMLYLLAGNRMGQSWKGVR